MIIIKEDVSLFQNASLAVSHPIFSCRWLTSCIIFDSATFTRSENTSDNDFGWDKSSRNRREG